MIAVWRKSSHRSTISDMWWHPNAFKIDNASSLYVAEIKITLHLWRRICIKQCCVAQWHMHLDYLNKTADLSRPDDISSNKIVTMTSTGSEEELYFEMEFNSKTEDEISISSKSVETLSNSSQSQVSQISHENSQDLFQDQRRGSSVGPILERPKYLRW